MKTNGTPNDLLPAMNQVGCIVFGPIISFIVYPQLHRRKIYLTPIIRITIGFVFTTLSMVWAAVLQLAIYNASPCLQKVHDCSSNKISVWLQAPVYLLMSIGEAFALTTGIEYAYSQAPEGAKAVVQAVNLLAAALGSVIAMSLTPVARHPNLVVFYAFLAGAMASTTAVFWFLFRNCGQRDLDDKSVECHRTVNLERKVTESAPQLEPIQTVGQFNLFQRSQGSPPPLPRRSSRRILLQNAPNDWIQFPRSTHNSRAA